MICEKVEIELNKLSPTECGCLLYTKSRTWDGYARMETKGVYRIHVYVLEKKLGRKLLPGMQALHTCDVRNCVAEDHLYEGTQRQNVQDMYQRGRGHNNYERGENIWSSTVKESWVRAIRKLSARGYSHVRIAAIFSIKPRAVSDIVRRMTWKHVE